MVSRDKSHSVIDGHNKMSIDMRNRLKRLAEIINVDDFKSRQHQSISLNTHHNSPQLSTIEVNKEILNSLKLYKK